MAEIEQVMECPKCGTTYSGDAMFCTRDATPLVRSDPDDPMVGKLLDGRYLLVKQLGFGGMGTVYQAQQVAVDRPVAVKLIRNTVETDQRIRQRFWVEARALSRLEHPNVVRIYDFGTNEENVPFLVMELLRGRTLAQEMIDVGLPIPFDRAAEIIMQASKGLVVAHNAGLIHRDLKPSNLWLGSDPVDTHKEQVKVIDFGLVREQANLPVMTSVHSVVGSPAYMSPEQAMGTSNLTSTVDVYALGAVLYHMVVGELPFPENTFREMLQAHVSKPVPQNTHTVDGRAIPASIQRVWTRCLEKMPEARYADGTELYHALTEVLEQLFVEGVDTHTPTPAAKSAIWTQETQTQQMAPVQKDRTRIATHHSVTDRERKRAILLTVRFADRPGTPPADIEERLELLEPVIATWQQRFEAMGTLFEGTEGYGFRAAFGIPVTRPGDGKVALQTAQQICDEAAANLGLSRFGLQVGLGYQQVIAERTGDSVAGGRLVGQPFEKVERMASSVPGHFGTPVLSEAIYETLRRVLGTEELQTRQTPQGTVYVLSGVSLVQSRPISDSFSMESVLGRPKALLHRLVSRVGSVLNAMEAALIHVVGEPGSGRTHLLGGLGAELQGHHTDTVVISGHGGQGHSTPFGLFRNLLQALSHQHQSARDDDRFHFLTAILSMDGGGQSSARASAILKLLGLQGTSLQVDSSPYQLKRRAFDAMTDLFGGLAARNGLVLLIDEFDNSDAASLDLLDHLVLELSDYPFVVVGAGSIDGAAASRYQPEFTIDPLSDSDTLQFIEALDSENRLTRSQRLAVVEQADGLPLFIEELVFAALADDSGDMSQPLPATLAAVLQAQIDRLEADQRAVLMRAAVVGPTFWTGTVTAQTRRDDWAKEQLARLNQNRVIEKVRTSFYPGEQEWRFRKQHLQAVAYEAVLKSERAQGHQAVAQWLENRSDDTRMAHLPLIASHLEQAGERDDAANAWMKVADYNEARYANQEAFTAVAHALSNQQHWPEAQLVDCRLRAGVLSHRLGDHTTAEDYLLAVCDSDEASSDAQIKALRFLSRIAGLKGDAQGRRSYCERALALRANGSATESLYAITEYTWVLNELDGPKPALEFISQEDPLPISEATSNGKYIGALANFYMIKADVANQGGIHQAADQAVSEGLSVCRQHGELEILPGLLHVKSALRRGRLDYSGAITLLMDAIEGFEKSGNVFHEVTARLNLGWCLLASGKDLEALQTFALVDEQSRPILAPVQNVYLVAGQALVLHGLNQSQRALLLATRALQKAEATGEKQALGWALLAMGVVESDPARLTAAVTQWRDLGRPYWLLMALQRLNTIYEGPQKGSITSEIDALRQQLIQS